MRSEPLPWYARCMSNQSRRNRRKVERLDTTRDHPREGEIKAAIREERKEKLAYYRTPAEQEDYEERHKGPVPRQLRAAYYSMIGDAPTLGPGDVEGAAEHLNKISAAIARGGWTRSEATRLRELHLKWWKRARGLDPYFTVFGNRRQWADHAKSQQERVDKDGVVNASKRIRQIVMDEVCTRKAEIEAHGETPGEKAARLEYLEAHRRVKDEETRMDEED